jgi:hypothetical protein
MPIDILYEQLLEDMKHIVTHMFEVIPRTILTPIPGAQTSSPSRKSRSAPTTSSSSLVTETGQNTWRTQKKTRSKKKATTADEHFQELAKDIHESNKNISNPYEQHDAEQCNWAFDTLMSDEKKDLVKRAKRLIILIKANDPLRTTSQGEQANCKEKLGTGTKAKRSRKCTNLNNSLTI